MANQKYKEIAILETINYNLVEIKQEEDKLIGKFVNGYKNTIHVDLNFLITSTDYIRIDNTFLYELLKDFAIDIRDKEV